MSERLLYSDHSKEEWEWKGYRLPESKQKLPKPLQIIKNIITWLDNMDHIKIHHKTGLCQYGYPSDMCPIYYPGRLEKWEKAHVKQ